MMCIISVSVYVHASVVCEEARRGHRIPGSGCEQTDLGAGTELRSFGRALSAPTHLCAQTFCTLSPALLCSQELEVQG